MYPILFEIGNFSFRSYGLMIAIGTLVGYWVAYRNRSKIGLKDDDMLDLLLLLIVFGIIGAKVTYILTNNPLYYFSNPKEIISGSGLSFIGIVIFGLATCWFYALKKKINFFGLIDVFSTWFNDRLCNRKNWMFSEWMLLRTSYYFMDRISI